MTTEGKGKARIQRKTVEPFVPWKQATLFDRREGSAVAAVLKSVEGNRKKGMSSGFTSSPRTIEAYKLSAEQGMAAVEASENSSADEGGQGQKGPIHRFEGHGGGDRSVAHVSLRKKTKKGRGSHSYQLTAQADRGVLTAMESPLQNLPTNKLRSMSKDKICGNVAGVYPNYEKVDKTVVSRNAGTVRGQLSSMHNAEQKSTSAKRWTTVSGSRRVDPAPTTVFEDDEVCGGPVDKDDNIDCGSPDQRLEKEPQPFLDDNEDKNEEELLQSKEKRALVVRFQEVGGAGNPKEIQEITLAEETAKRKERRQAQAMREKEGDRRKKEGLPRNFLLVDEYTKKPYSVGVGDWRKELMLLSHNLDPAIGNIKQQPQDDVVEIAEWIQHTWEYSSPIKFDYVREVIARGVTLRRTDLWRKIRNNEPKPEGLSDRSWRILERQLDSSATIRKSESCSKANTSRSNFGRTGPSGEVGVRERLRRRFQRSPDPEEIRFEMARNKGYGGQYRRKKEQMNVMHGQGGVRNLAMQWPSIEGPTDNSYRSASSPNDEDKYEVDVGDDKDHDVVSSGGTSGNIDRRGVQALSVVEVAQHPLVLKMMERLEALEGRHFIDKEGRSANLKKSLNLGAVEPGVHTAKEHKSTAEVQIRHDIRTQEFGEDDENERVEETLTCGHPKKRGKHE